jgi:DNA-binding transcriptional LysR family regulator
MQPSPAILQQGQISMNWDDLRYFLALARTRTLGAAAQKLGVDATTVGRRIERLSALLGTSLFETGPAGHMLTASGDELLRHAEDVERAILSAGSALTGERSRFSGTVRLSLSEGFASWVVAPHLPAFAQSHPEIALEIVTTNGFLNPSKREADLAVMLARPAQGPLLAAKLADYSLGLYASADYLAGHAPVTGVAGLGRHRLIGYIPDFIYADELRYLSEVDAGLHPAFSSSSINVQFALTQAGLGIGILPHFIGSQSAALRRILPEDVRITRSFWTVVHRDLSRVSRVRAVLDWLRQIVHGHTLLDPAAQ